MSLHHTTPSAALVLKGLKLDVFLGWPDEERQQKQTVIIDLTLSFIEPPRATLSDHIDDTFCYASLIETCKQKTSPHSYRLLEHLGYELYRIIKEFLSVPMKVSLQITKFPPIPELTGGACFIYGDQN